MEISIKIKEQMKKYILGFFLLCLGFCIGYKYTLDKKKEFNSKIITSCIINISEANTLKNFLSIEPVHKGEVLKIQYNNTSSCIDFEKFNIKLIKFDKNTTDTFKIKISEVIKPHEEVEIAVYDFKCDSIKILDYEIIAVNLSDNLR